MVGLVGRLPLLTMRARLAPARPGDGPIGLLSLGALAEQLAALKMQQPLGAMREPLGIAAIRARIVRLPSFHSVTPCLVCLRADSSTRACQKIS